MIKKINEMQRHYVISLILVIMLIPSCKGQNVEKEGLGSFDLSANDKQIVFSFLKNGVSSLYLINSDGTNLKKIINLKGENNFYNPKYSPDGKRIVFILSRHGCINSTLCISNSDGSGILYLTDDKHIITEATFSLNGEIIYFCKANVYEKYSPIGRKDAHDFDIYALSIKDKKISKLSNLKSYGLSNISELDNKYILIHIESGPDGGMYLYSKEKAIKERRLVPVNNPRQDASIYYTPIYSDCLNIIGFTAPYEIYIMSLKDNNAKLVFSNKGSNDISNIAFFKNQKKILFSKVGISDLFSINIDGTGIQTIPIIIR